MYIMLSSCGNAAMDRTAGQAVTVSDVLEAGVKDDYVGKNGGDFFYIIMMKARKNIILRV